MQARIQRLEIGRAVGSRGATGQGRLLGGVQMLKASIVRASQRGVEEVSPRKFSVFSLFRCIWADVNFYRSL